MTDINLSQNEANRLLQLPKRKLDNQKWDYPSFGGKISIPLTSDDKHEEFILDISKGRIDLLRGKHQNRARQVIILARIDFGGPPHRNPDGMEIPCPHIHLYKEGFGDKWAYPIPANKFPNIDDPSLTIDDFMDYCNIVEKPIIQMGLY